ncbi:hypothetical protein J6590_028311 [Homalodisca vitripennis]|nr:hypothetical protein J6590_028311 [Homalodisca vitripennis]
MTAWVHIADFKQLSEEKWVVVTAIGKRSKCGGGVLMRATPSVPVCRYYCTLTFVIVSSLRCARWLHLNCIYRLFVPHDTLIVNSRCHRNLKAPYFLDVRNVDGLTSPKSYWSLNGINLFRLQEASKIWKALGVLTLYEHRATFSFLTLGTTGICWFPTSLLVPYGLWDLLIFSAPGSRPLQTSKSFCTLAVQYLLEAAISKSCYLIDVRRSYAKGILKCLGADGLSPCGYSRPREL